MDQPRHAGAAHRKADNETSSSFIREVAIVLVGAIVLALVIKTFIIQAFYIPSSSMEPTLEINDRIVVQRWVPRWTEIKRGDVVVFEDTNDWLRTVPASSGPGTWIRDGLATIGLMPASSDNHLVKRVIGIGGDRVECCDDDGRLMVNGHSIDETYIKPGAIPSQVEFTALVPEGHLWVMGDNRQNSADSREHMGGPGGGYVPESDVVGKVGMIVWPLSRFGTLESATHVFAEVPSRPADE